MNNNLPERIRGHLAGCPLCLALAECEAGAMLFAQVEFEARRRFYLWLDGTEVLFYPSAPNCWHVRFAFNVGPESKRWLTAHYTGNPPGSIKDFSQAIDYARLMIQSASLDLMDYLRGIRPAPVIASLSGKE